VLARCAAAGAPYVLFPSDSPSHATGNGAIVWPAGAGCPGGAGARLDAIAPGAAPAAPAPPRTARGAALAPAGALGAAAGPRGLIAVAGADPRRPGRALVVEGRTGGPFAALARAGARAPGVALATAYLGDLGLLAPAGGALSLEVQRWFGGPPGPPREVTAPSPGSAGATVALDYRSDALVAWTARGSVWARALPASGRKLPAQRLGPAGRETRIAAMLSDDNRAIVLWSAERAGAADVYLDQSATGPRFAAPARRIEHARYAEGLAAPGASPRLVRLSSESVMAAWTGVEGGDLVIRTAPIDQRGLRTVSTLAAPGSDAVLAALAPGPRGDAVMLLTERPKDAGLPAAGGQVLLAALGSEAAGRTLFATPEPVAPPGAVTGASAGFEPATDRAFAAWRGPGGVIEYSVLAP
jgi:hypothetical protein